MSFMFVKDAHKATIGDVVSLKMHPGLTMQVVSKDYEEKTFDVIWLDLKLQPQMMAEIPWSCFNEVSGPSE